jgi:single-strand DNA-binding protein
MSGINKVILLGRLGKDPEHGTTSNGKEYSRFSLATSYGSREKEVTQWHNVTVWNEFNARYIKDYAVKGSTVYVEGEIEYRQYDKDGVTMYATNILVNFNGTVQVIKDGRGRGDNEGGTRTQAGTGRARGAASYAEQSGGRGAPPKDMRDDLDDEIPF